MTQDTSTLRRRYSSGLSLLANYTLRKNLSDAPDFRSPMFEAAIPQNNNDLRAEKGPACDVRHRFALSAVYDIRPAAGAAGARHLTRNWRVSTLYQVAERFPVHDFGLRRHSQCGDGARRKSDSRQLHGTAGVRARNAHHDAVVQSRGFCHAGRVHIRQRGTEHRYGPGMQTLDLALVRSFVVTERCGSRCAARLSMR